MDDVTGKAWDSRLFWRILSYSYPYRKLLTTGLILTILLAFLSPLRPYIIGIMVGDYVRLGQEDNLLLGALIVVALLIMESIGQFKLTYLANDLGQRVIRDIRKELFKHIVFLWIFTV